MTVNIRDGFNTRRADSIHVRHGGSTITVAKAFVNDGGNIREVFDYASTPEQTIAYSGTSSNRFVPSAEELIMISLTSNSTFLNTNLRFTPDTSAAVFNTPGSTTLTAATRDTAVPGRNLADDMWALRDAITLFGGNSVNYASWADWDTQYIHIDLPFAGGDRTVALSATSLVVTIGSATATFSKPQQENINTTDIVLGPLTLVSSTGVPPTTGAISIAASGFQALVVTVPTTTSSTIQSVLETLRDNTISAIPTITSNGITTSTQMLSQEEMATRATITTGRVPINQWDLRDAAADSSNRVAYTTWNDWINRFVHTNQLFEDRADDIIGFGPSWGNIYRLIWTR